MTQNSYGFKTGLFKFCLSKMFCDFDDEEKYYLSFNKTSYFDALLSLD